MAEIEVVSTDFLILGAGGAGLMAALHAHDFNPELDITIAVKGLLGKSGCTRMVQGGYNVAIGKGDSIERHFMDTIEGGKWINDQDLAWTLVNGAVKCIHELENRYGCFFDRNEDGTVHQKAFAGQTFDRTVHKGDLTGIEIVNRLAEQTWSRGINRLEDHRAIALIRSDLGDRISGVLFIDMREGTYKFVQARAVLLATGGGPTMYRYHTPSGDKSCDGLSMALSAGLVLRDMEMVQFHPTGLLAGSDTRMTGTIIEEGLRGSGGHLLNGSRDRFMHNYDEREERATRDIVSRAMYQEMRDGRTTPAGGLYISMGHLESDMVRDRFKGMVKRCADCGFDLVSGFVEVVPTAHYLMGGVVFNTECRTSMEGLYCAGEDSGGVHGANRLGGNGVANSTVFGGIAGESIARYLVDSKPHSDPDLDLIEYSTDLANRPFDRPPGDMNRIREELLDLMWERVGISRTGAGLRKAMTELDRLGSELKECGIPDSNRAYNLTWHDWLNLRSQIHVSKSITRSALARDNSRGAHYREDFPEAGDLERTVSICASEPLPGEWVIERKTVSFTRVNPGETLIDEAREAEDA